MQPKTISLDPSRVRTDIHPLAVSGFSYQSGLLTYENSLIYSAGNHLIVDPIDPTQNQYSLKGHDNAITCLCLSRDGSVASGQLGSPGSKNYDSPVFIWKLSMAKPQGFFEGMKEGVKNLIFSKNGSLLAGVSHKDQLIIWDVKSQKQIFAKIFEFPINILHFSNENLVVTVGKGIQDMCITPLLTQNKPPIFTNFTLPSTGLPRNYTSLVEVDNN